MSTPAIQPALPADFAEPQPKPSRARQRIEDFETWVETVRPTFVKVAKSGRRQFLCWQIEDEYQLPDPPQRSTDWGRLMARLHKEGLIQPDGFGYTRDKSGITAWTGTRAARAGRAA